MMAICELVMILLVHNAEEQAKNAAELKVQVLEQKLRALQREIALKDAY
jgi:hypothetical protein